MTKSLFHSFPEVSAKEWKQKIQFDLKGEDYNEALIYKSLEGIDIKPFYTSEDLPKTYQESIATTPWKNALYLVINNADEGNSDIKQGIKLGAESFYLVISSTDIHPTALLSSVSSDTPLYVETKFISQEYTEQLIAATKQYGLQLSLATDIIGNLATTGNWFSNYKVDFAELQNINANSSDINQGITVDLGIYQNAGATMVQQLAYGLAHANEYLNFFNNTNVNTLQQTPCLLYTSPSPRDA